MTSTLSPQPCTGLNRAGGRIVLAGEPLLEVTAPLPQAQLVERYVLSSAATGNPRSGGRSRTNRLKVAGPVTPSRRQDMAVDVVQIIHGRKRADHPGSTRSHSASHCAYLLRSRSRRMPAPTA